MLLLHESLSYVPNNRLNAGKEGTRIRTTHGEKACKCFIKKYNEVHGKFQEFRDFLERIQTFRSCLNWSFRPNLP